MISTFRLLQVYSLIEDLEITATTSGSVDRFLPTFSEDHIMSRCARLLAVLPVAALLASCSGPDPDQLVREMGTFYEQVKTLQVTCRTTASMQGGGKNSEMTVTMTIAAERPNLLSVRTTGGMIESDVVSDGGRMFTHLPILDTYVEQAAPAGYGEFAQDANLSSAMGGGMGVLVLKLLADDLYGYIMDGVTSSEYVGKETLDGHDVHHLGFTRGELNWEMWIGAGGTPLLHKLSVGVPGEESQQPGMTESLVKQYQNWKIDETIAPDAFTFQPPADAKSSDNLMVSLARAARRAQPQSPLVGQPAPPVELDLLDGGTLSLQTHADRDIVILDFWATWCKPCRLEMPVVLEVSQRYRDRGVVFYAVNLRESRGRIRGYLDQEKLDVAVALDTKGSVAVAYEASALPTLVLIDKSGVIRSVHTGFNLGLRYELVEEIDELLADENIEGKPEPKPPAEETME